MKINYLDLFSGIGGFHLGFERAGFKVNSYFSEINKYAIQVYKDKFKNSNYVGSVTDVRGGDLPDIDLITFGSPCQDFSLAGKRKGLEGKRSSLISEAIRLIREKRPRVFVWENVKGTFSSNNRRDFAAILQAFANIGGYRLEWQLLNTKWFLPQNRERVYLVGYIGDGSRGQVFPLEKNNRKVAKISKEQTFQITNFSEREYGWKNYAPCLKARDYEDPKAVKIIAAQRGRSYRGQPQQLEYRLDGNTNTLSTVQKDNYVVKAGTLRTHKDGKGFREIKDGDCPTIPARAREDGSGQPIVKINSATSKGYEVAKEGDSINYSVPTSKTRRGRVGKGVAETLDTACNQAVMESTKIRRLTPIECERLQGFPDDWTKRGTEGLISDTQRYKMCGNAVTVDVVAAVAERIKKVI
jgi:DNA (cytosine-5)-methyltransferase 1